MSEGGDDDCGLKELDKSRDFLKKINTLGIVQDFP